MNSGFDIKLLSQKTGIAEGTIKLFLHRKPELREKPYSLKSGGNRIFFPAFVDWLKKYYKVTEVTNSETFVTSVPPSQNAKLPNGSQLREMRLMVKEHILSTDQVRSLLYLVPSQSSDKPALPQPEKKTVYLPSLPTKEEQADQIVGRRVRAKQARKTEDHKTQIRLFEDGI